MTINSRTKGAAGEREFAGLIFDQLGIKLIRNLEQSRNGGHDLIPTEPGTLLEPFAIECKRYKTAQQADLTQWWDQALKQAEIAGKTPILAYRLDRQDWKIIAPLHVINPNLSISNNLESSATISLFAFCSVVRESF